jgi:hypothetical protein
MNHSDTSNFLSHDEQSPDIVPDSSETPKPLETDEADFNLEKAIERAKSFIRDPYFWRLATIDRIEDNTIFCRTQDSQDLECVKTIEPDTKTNTHDEKLLTKFQPGDEIVVRLHDNAKEQRGVKSINYIHYDDGKLWGYPFGTHMFEAVKGALREIKEENPESYSHKISEEVQKTLNKPSLFRRLFS